VQDCEVLWPAKLYFDEWEGYPLLQYFLIEFVRILQVTLVGARGFRLRLV